MLPTDMLPPGLEEDHESALNIEPPWVGGMPPAGEGVCAGRTLDPMPPGHTQTINAGAHSRALSSTSKENSNKTTSKRQRKKRSHSDIQPPATASLPLGDTALALPPPEMFKGAFLRLTDLVLRLRVCAGQDGDAAHMDCRLSAMLALLLARPSRPDGGIECSWKSWAAASGVSFGLTRSLGILMARWGLLTVVRVFDEQQRAWAPSVAFINPQLRDWLASPKAGKAPGALVGHFAAIGLPRAPEDRLQGFLGYDVRYGSPEPFPGTPAAVGLRLADWARAERDTDQDALEELTRSTPAAKQSPKQQAEALRKQRAAEAQAFVKAAGALWMQSQVSAGRQVSGPPAWCGEPAKLSPENRRAYRELQALFEGHGGFKVAVAWGLFCSAKPKLDKKGKPAFGLGEPWAQYASLDKKPAQFAKHFDSIYSSMPEYFSDKAFIGRVRAYFGDAMDIAASRPGFDIPAPPAPEPEKPDWRWAAPAKEVWEYEWAQEAKRKAEAAAAKAAAAGIAPESAKTGPAITEDAQEATALPPDQASAPESPKSGSTP